MRAVWLLALVACHGPSETGPGGIVGHLSDASGQPLEGVRIESLEAEYRTDAEGHFAVSWKPPSTHVFFERGGVYWQRKWLPESDGAEVVWRLPETRAVTLDCGEATCAVALDWELGPGESARATARCEAGGSMELPAVPRGEPVLGCKAKGEALDVVLVDDGRTLALRPPKVPLRVELRSVEGELPEGCVVRVGEVEASPGGTGFWVADQEGDTTVRVACEGRQAWPVEVPFGRGSVAVDWSRAGPEVDLEGRFPEAATLRLRPLASQTWLEVAPVGDGLFPLPPTPAGTYAAAVVVDGSPEEGALVEAEGSGRLELRPVEGGGAVGVLRLEADATSGRVPVELREATP